MSESESSGAGQREVAYRIFAAEFEAADYDYSESDEERAPNYVVTPTGARANRLFVVGVLTEIEQVSEDVLRARVVDPTGAFVLYAGQYQPDEQAFLERAEPPMFVAVTGKARTFQPEDSEQVFTSVRPESISEVDADTRDRWTVQTAEQTLDRVRWMSTALTLDDEETRPALRQRGADDGLAHGIELALAHYGTTPTYLDALRELSLDAARVVAGEADEVAEFTTAPDASGDVTAFDLAANFTLPEPDDQSEESAVSESSPAGDQQTAEPTEAAPPTEGDTASASASEESTDSMDIDSEPESAESSTESVASSSAETAEPTKQSTTDTTESATETPDTTESVTTEESPASEDSTATAAETTESTTTDSESTESTTAAADDLGDFEPEEFELEEETREEIEDEYGTEFQSGTEVEEPGNADIETPDPEELDGPDGESASESDEKPAVEESAKATEPESESAEAPASEPEPAAEGSPEPDETADSADGETATGSETESVDDPQQAAVDLMGELDDGDGASRDQLIAQLDERYGIDSETAEDAIQSALMEGQCYEPDDERLKPI